MADDALAGLTLERIGRSLESLDDVDSTMDHAWRLAEEGAGDGAVVVARRQRAGRGRQGRTWQSPEGGLWLSVVLEPPAGAFGPTALPIAAALAVADAILRTTAIETRLRWPNDVLIEGRKVAGVLVESRTTGPLVRFVLGIGIDVDVAAEALGPDVAPRATSLSQAAGRTIDPATVLPALLVELDRRYGQLLERPLAEIEADWLARSSTLGRRVALSTPDGRREGRIVAISIAGGLSLEEDDGVVRTWRGEHCTLLDADGP